MQVSLLWICDTHNRYLTMILLTVSKCQSLPLFQNLKYDGVWKKTLQRQCNTRAVYFDSEANLIHTYKKYNNI